jgi:hypothetical protein
MSRRLQVLLSAVAFVSYLVYPLLAKIPDLQSRGFDVSLGGLLGYFPTAYGVHTTPQWLTQCLGVLLIIVATNLAVICSREARRRQLLFDRKVLVVISLVIVLLSAYGIEKAVAWCDLQATPSERYLKPNYDEYPDTGSKLRAIVADSNRMFGDMEQSYLHYLRHSHSGFKFLLCFWVVGWFLASRPFDTPTGLERGTQA